MPTTGELLLDDDAAREVIVIRGLVEMDAINEATIRLARIADSQALYDLRTRREFEPLWTDPVAQTYLRAEDFAARYISAARARSQQSPRDLDARNYLHHALLTNGEFDEAIEATQETLRNLSSYRTNREAEGWVRHYLAYALMARGEYAAANAAIRPMVRIASRSQAYLANFSINYGLMSLAQENYDEARNAARLAERSPISNFGRSITRFINVCALQGLGQTAEADMALDLLVGSPGQSPFLTLDALLCLNRSDQAANLLVTMLNDESLRARALRSLQECIDNPNLPTLWRRERAKLAALRNRPEVQQAVSKAGVVIVRPYVCGF